MKVTKTSKRFKFWDGGLNCWRISVVENYNESVHGYETLEAEHVYKRHKEKVAILLAAMSPEHDMVYIEGIGSIENFGEQGPMIRLEKW